MGSFRVASTKLCRPIAPLLPFLHVSNKVYISINLTGPIAAPRHNRCPVIEEWLARLELGRGQQGNRCVINATVNVPPPISPNLVIEHVGMRNPIFFNLEPHPESGRLAIGVEAIN
jgi:hypothetical protein